MPKLFYLNRNKHLIYLIKIIIKNNLINWLPSAYVPLYLLLNILDFRFIIISELKFKVKLKFIFQVKTKKKWR